MVFTGLHGTGTTTVVEVLRQAGFKVDVEPTLEAAERSLLRQWLAEGANTEPHWSFQPLPAEVPRPAIRDTS